MSGHEMWPPLESYLALSPVTQVPLALGIVVALVAVGYLYTFYERRADISHIPILAPELGSKGRKAAYAQDGKQFLQRGYEEYNLKGKPFQIEATEGPVIVLNAAQVDEVAVKPDHIVDNMRPNGRGVMDHYTGYLDGDETIFRIIKSQLSTRLGELGEILAHQTDECLAKELPACEDWTPVNFYSRITRVVAAISTRVFTGEELTANEEWLATTIAYTGHLMGAAHAIQKTNPWLRPFVYRSLPEFKTLMATQATALRLVKPLIEKRRVGMDKPGFVGSNDMLQWMLVDRVKKSFHDTDYEYLSQYQLQLAFAAIHTTSMALTNMLYDLLAHPELIQILRDEVKEQLAKNGGSWEGNFLKGLQKVDSFMKESQRHNPVGFSAMHRDILEPVTLADGTFLPKGCTIHANAYAITHDPAVLLSDTDPNSFDGLRYYKLRKQLLKTGMGDKEVAGKHQFVSVSSSSLMFGAGKHACPGRFFAGNEIKLILAKLVTTFDFRSEAKERYPNFSWEGSNIVDTTKNVVMKRIV